ncbi:MAG: hypothetical protein ACJ8C3_06955, partial [Microvirga sp.]
MASLSSVPSNPDFIDFTRRFLMAMPIAQYMGSGNHRCGPAVQPLEDEMMRRHFWRWWPHKTKERPDAPEQLPRKSGSEDRRKLLKALSAMAGGTALFSYSGRSEAKDATDLPPPKRALTGRDEAG